MAINIFMKVMLTMTMKVMKKGIAAIFPQPLIGPPLYSSFEHWNKMERFREASCIKLFHDSPVMHLKRVSMAIQNEWKLECSLR